jgi:hypothetical protein
VIITLVDPVLNTEVVTFDYTLGSNPIEDIVGSAADAITGQSVTQVTKPILDSTIVAYDTTIVITLIQSIGVSIGLNSLIKITSWQK